MTLGTLAKSCARLTTRGLPIALLLAVLAVGCEQAPDSEASVPVDTLSAELLIRHPAIGAPALMQPWGDHLLVSDGQGQPLMHAVDTATGDLAVSFGREGAGPGEFFGSIAGMQVPRHDPTAAWVFDMLRMTRLARPGIVSGTDPRRIDLTAAPQLLEAGWLDSATIVGVRLQPPEERFVFLDTAGAVVRRVPGGLFGDGGVPRSERARASAQFRMCVDPEGLGFVIAYKQAPIVEIYDHAAELLTAAGAPGEHEPLFKMVDGDLRFVAERHFYSSCAISGRLVYAAYTGKDYASHPGVDLLMAETVHVFDWDGGRLARILHIDTPVSGIAVTEDGRWLYGSSYADAGVYRFRIPESR